MTTIVPKKRINSIDALRGFALIGIMLLHCMERFDLTLVPEVNSPFWQCVDKGVYDTVYFLFSGKAYAIFSFLFGLSFYMQMDSQAQKGNDFRMRFVWRLILLFLFGYINGLVYMGEFFVVYAVLGLLLVPLYKVPTKWLVGIMILLFLQIPALISFVSLLQHNVPNEPTALNSYMNQLYTLCAGIFIEGSFTDVLSFNLWQGQFAKWLWLINNFRYLHYWDCSLPGCWLDAWGFIKMRP